MPKRRATDFEDLPVAIVPVKKFLVALRHAQATTLDSSKRGEKGHHGSLYAIHLLGVEAEQEVWVEATDTHRLFSHNLQSAMVTDFDVLIPAEQVPGIITYFDDPRRSLRGDMAIFVADVLGGKARRIELAYGTERQMALYAVTDVEWPDVKAHSVDPRRSAPSIWMHRMPNRLTVARAWLLECCRKAIKDKADKITVESKLNLVTASWLRRTKEEPDNRVLKEIRNRILKEIRASGEDGESFNEQPFNPRYLRDALAACEENVVTLYAPPKKGDACVLGDTVIMPMIDSKGA